MTPESLTALRLVQPMIHGSLTLLHAGRCRSGHDSLNCLDKLRAETPQHEWRTVQVDHVVAQGEAGTAIVECVRKLSADLVVLGSPARLREASQASNSTVSQVIAGVPCPVLCIPCGKEYAVERPLPAHGTVEYAAAGRHVA